jgi:hypothetical protein
MRARAGARILRDQERPSAALARKRREAKVRTVHKGVTSVRRDGGESDLLLALIGQAGNVGSRSIARRHDEVLAVVERQHNRPE